MTTDSIRSHSPDSRMESMNPRPNRIPSQQPRNDRTKDETSSNPKRDFKPPQNVQATNFQTVKYRMPISGTYVIDPGLEMPADLIVDNPTKKSNLTLECGRGSIAADIWLVTESMSQLGIRNDARRAVIDVHCKSWLGKVDVQLFNTSVYPFTLSASSNGGDINIALPSDFVGPVTLSTGSIYDNLRLSSFTPFAPSAERESSSGTSGHSEVRTVPFSTSFEFSDAVKARLVTFSETGSARTCFIGNYRSAGYTSRKDWSGSIVDIQSSFGSLKISFVGERQVMGQAGGCMVM